MFLCDASNTINAGREVYLENSLEVLINFIPEALKILLPHGIRTQDLWQRKPALHSTPLAHITCGLIFFKTHA